MSRPHAELRVLAELPKGMTVDSDPVMLDGEVIVPRTAEEGGGAWAGRADRECDTCHGRSLVTGLNGEGGRFNRPCSCILRAIDVEKVQAKVGAGRVSSSGGSTPTAAPTGGALQARRERVLQMIATEKAKLDQAVAARAAAMAPHLSRWAVLLHDIEALLRGEQAAEEALENEAAALQSATEEVEIATLVQMACLDELAETQCALMTIRDAIADYRTHAEEAQAEAERAGAGGGYRHRIQTQERRLADLRVRLVAIERDLAGSAGATGSSFTNQEVTP